jgi:hypothetical protein
MKKKLKMTATAKINKKPYEVILLLMQERGLRNKDLEPALPQLWRDFRSHHRQAQTEQDTG